MRVIKATFQLTFSPGDSLNLPKNDAADTSPLMFVKPNVTKMFT